ncbi:MAG: cob(I)yrinic acid a,c-diamide adenosyltransferase [Actinomycetota bacterium]
MTKNKKGLILINTGDGKGKTTAALGIALRAAGHNLKVLILQFIKGPWKSGELRPLENIPQIEVEKLGIGFIEFNQGKPVITKEQKRNARESFKYAQEKINRGTYDMVILDEILNLLSYNLIKEADLINLLKNKSKNLIIILTGNKVPESLVEMADTVTEMKSIKHAYEKGIKAIKGIEY